MQSRRVRKKLSVLFMACNSFGIAGCATMNKEECAQADWNHVGFVDGKMGKVESYIEEHRKSCGENLPNTYAYEDGRKRGLTEYCSPSSAYHEGAEGRDLLNLCPSEIMPELKRQNAEGRKTFALTSERNRLRQELRDKSEKIQKDKTVVGDIGKIYHLLSGVSPTAREEKRIDELSDKIMARETLKPEGPAPIPSLQERVEQNPLPFFRNFIAISTGATLGFGVGHAIQGTYRQHGWKWTAIDAANIVGLSIASAQCSTAPDSLTGQRGTKATGACVGSPLSLVAGLMVSRVWQGIELGKSSSRAYIPYNVTIVPNDDGGNLLGTWSW